jgi:ribosomal protein S2
MLVKDFFLNFSLLQFIRFYIHIGCAKTYTNMLMKNYLFGGYFNLSIINLYFFLNFFRSNLNIFIKTMLVQSKNFLLICENKNLFYVFGDFLLKNNVSFFFGN